MLRVLVCTIFLISYFNPIIASAQVPMRQISWQVYENECRLIFKAGNAEQDWREDKEAFDEDFDGAVNYLARICLSVEASDEETRIKSADGKSDAPYLGGGAEVFVGSRNCTLDGGNRAERALIDDENSCVLVYGKENLVVSGRQGDATGTLDLIILQ